MDSHWILGEKFDYEYPHHGSMKDLWEKKWGPLSQKSVWPFAGDNHDDFQKVFDELIKKEINDPTSDDYTNAFTPVVKDLLQQAEQAEDQQTVQLYSRASALLRISRFPHIGPNSLGVKKQALDLQNKIFLKGAALMEPPIREVKIPHIHRSGKDGDEIPVLLRLTKKGSVDELTPLVIIFTGLDGYRADNAYQSDALVKFGWSTMLCEIPGTGDCPAEPIDPQSPDRVWTSLLEWVERESQNMRFDLRRIAVWGLSAGGYYAARIAHTHHDKLVGVVAQGAGTHHFLRRDWLEKASGHEYPFDVVPPFAAKCGFDNVEDFLTRGMDLFSLVKNGITDMPSCKLLIINGVDDGLVPIEDSIEMLKHGSPKEARFFTGCAHMGGPESFPTIHAWLKNLLK